MELSEKCTVFLTADFWGMWTACMAMAWQCYYLWPWDETLSALDTQVLCYLNLGLVSGYVMCLVEVVDGEEQ